MPRYERYGEDRWSYIVPVAFTWSQTSNTLDDKWGRWHESSTTSTPYHYPQLYFRSNALTYSHREWVVSNTRVLTAENCRTATPQQVAQAERGISRRSQSRTEANSRAAELLLSVLDADQRAAYLRNESFEVVGSMGNRYRINPAVSGNIEFLDGQQVAGVLCAHPDMVEGWLPTADVMLSQLLALTTDEPGFLRIANLHRGRRPSLRLAASA